MNRCNLLALPFGLILILSMAACQSSPAESVEGEDVQASINITSTAFSDGDEIPIRHTCDGEDLSPPLSLTEIPAGTQSLVVIVDDPDAPGGTFVHWVLYDIPPDSPTLGEGLSSVGTQGMNGFGRSGYDGPCPPKGQAHRYFFKVYALDTPLDLQSGATKAEVETAMQDHIQVQGELVGTYQR